MPSGGSIPAWAGETPPHSGQSSAIRVYPRVGGGNATAVGGNIRKQGLSPRGRGKHRLGKYHRGERRSIPAWAGETLRNADVQVLYQVYPRVGGGNAKPRPAPAPPPGLSPRGRGKPAISLRLAPVPGSIPAWAGETLARAHTRHGLGVYPRVGGGNTPPFGGGRIADGLSPRGRGKLLRFDHHRQGQGSIPAWAGETAMEEGNPTTRRVYPRVGGGNRLPCFSICWAIGLSPRGRGKRAIPKFNLTEQRSIPAWAGETAADRRQYPGTRVYPRVGGGNHRRGMLVGRAVGLSPRGRGKRPSNCPPLRPAGSIPAWAGETNS